MELHNLVSLYQRRLTDLSANNRSLYLPKLYANQYLDFTELHLLRLGAPAEQLLEKVVIQSKYIPLCHTVSSRENDVNQISRKFQALKAKEKLLQQEQGTSDFYIGYPFVYGRLGNGMPVCCPLIYFKYNLETNIAAGGKSEWALTNVATDSPILNTTFLLAYLQTMPAPHTEVVNGAFTYENWNDTLSFKNFLYAWLKNSNLEIHFNSDLFSDKLLPFYNPIDENVSEGRLKLMPFAVMGLFPQTGAYIGPDYKYWLMELPKGSVEDYFLSKNRENTFNKLKEEHYLCPYPMDEWQEEAITTIKNGQSIVIQGPPGSGKSQLIANIAADYASVGKKVLIVCQKQAALEVIEQRFNEKNLHPFLALVHDTKEHRKTLFEKIHAQIVEVDTYQKQNQSLDTVWLEREYLQTCRQISEITEKLEAYKKALFNSDRLGISVKELYLKCRLEQQPLQLNENDISGIKYPALPGLISTFELLYDYKKLFHPYADIIKHRKNFAVFGLTHKAHIGNLLDELLSFCEQNKPFIALITQKKNDLRAIREWLIAFENADVKEAFFYTYFPTPTCEFSVQPLFEMIYNNADEWPEISIIHSDLTKKMVEDALSVLSKPLQGFLWKIFNPKAKKLKTDFQKHSVALELSELTALSEKWKRYEHDRQTLWNALPESLQTKYQAHSAYNLLDFFTRLKSILQKTIDNPWILHNVRQYGQEAIGSIKETITKYDALYTHAQMYFEEQWWESACNNYNFIRKSKQVVSDYFDDLVAYDKLLLQLTNGQKNCFDAVYHPNLGKQEFTAYFQNSLFYTWILKLEALNPLLKLPSTLEMGHLESQLQSLIVIKQQLITDIVRLKLRENTYKNMAYNRLQNRVTYRDLTHQVTKKKQLWTLRQIMQNFANEVFGLLPVWLCSPEAVSAIFPTEEIFDLVIFDEASQCYAERALPATLRAKQIVVMGDKHQLPPSDFYTLRYETDAWDTPEAQADAWLDVCSQYYPTLPLRGHYRSQVPELIAFSNEQFYNNQLHILPDYKVLSENRPAIVYIKTEGIWHDRKNATEAEATVRLALELFGKHPEKTLGIITFNATQQQLIQELFFSLPEYDALVNNNRLFIKNIENVQGDERDIIIFSVGYAPDKNGRFTAQFGSLNQEGGENRLNVAITRAKEQIYLITSIWPHQMQVEYTLNRGAKMLKKYLEYAYQISNGQWKPHSHSANNFGLEWYLKNAIIRTCTNIKPFELPFADAVFAKSEQKPILIVTDDDNMYNCPNMKAYFGYRPLLLNRKNWIHTRVHSREYFAEQESKIFKKFS